MLGPPIPPPTTRGITVTKLLTSNMPITALVVNDHGTFYRIESGMRVWGQYHYAVSAVPASFADHMPAEQILVLPKNTRRTPQPGGSNRG